MVIRLVEQRVVTPHSGRLVGVMALDVEQITCGSFSLPSNGVASPTSASVHETAYTCTSFGSYVASASQEIAISNTFAGYLVSCGMPPSVLHATVGQNAEVIFGDVVTYTCEERTTDCGVFEFLTG